MKKPTIILKTSLSEPLQKKLHEHFDVVNMRKDKHWVHSAKNFSNEIEGVLTNGHDGASAELIENLPNLKIISCNGVGYDAVNVRKAISENIMVTHTPGVLDKDVANTTIMLLLAISRRLTHDINWIKSGAWQSDGGPPLTQSIEGKKVGLLGLGRIGECIAKKLGAFDCDISYHCRNKKNNLPYLYFHSLLELAQHVDFLIAITPGDASTYHIINQPILEALGKQGTLINVARGSVVDEQALICALKDGTLGAAALDVFADEPNAPPALFEMDNVLMTPHVGSATHETRYAMGDLAINNLIEFFEKSEPITAIPECQ